MTEKISNKTLVGLLIVAIMISLMGTWVSLTKINQLGFLTGMTTEEGTATLVITGYAFINVSDNAIDFKEGHVNTSDGALYADLWSNGTSVDWTNTSSAHFDEDYLEVDNLGNLNIDLDINSNVTNETFACQGQTLGTDCGRLVGPDFGFWTENGTAPGCIGSLEGSSSSPTQFDDTNDKSACTEMAFGSDNQVKLYLYAKIPSDAVGTKHSKLTFVATEP